MAAKAVVNGKNMIYQGERWVQDFTKEFRKTIKKNRDNSINAVEVSERDQLLIGISNGLMSLGNDIRIYLDKKREQIEAVDFKDDALGIGEDVK